MPPLVSPSNVLIILPIYFEVWYSQLLDGCYTDTWPEVKRDDGHFVLCVSKALFHSFRWGDCSLCTLAETWAVLVCLLWSAAEVCGRGHKHLPMSLCQRFDVSLTCKLSCPRTSSPCTCSKSVHVPTRRTLGNIWLAAKSERWGCSNTL